VFLHVLPSGVIKIDDDDKSPLFMIGRMKTGSEYLTEQGIAHETGWDLWRNIVALAVIFIGLLIVAYIQLRRIKKLK